MSSKTFFLPFLSSKVLLDVAIQSKSLSLEISESDYRSMHCLYDLLLNL